MFYHSTATGVITRPGKYRKKHGTSPFFMGIFTISMVIFHIDVKLPEGIDYLHVL